MQTAKAIYDYTSKKPEGIIFKAGEDLEVLAVIDDNWVKLRKPDGGPNSEGIAPANYIRRNAAENVDNNTAAESDTLKRTASTPETKSTDGQCLYDYKLVAFINIFS